MAKMMPDAEIARKANAKPIGEVAASLGLTEDELQFYGRDKAKIWLATWDRLKDKPDGQLILVTAMTPTPAGEGKTTTAIGVVDALRRLGKNAIATLREPSMGPVFGMKGGATGGGYAQVIPMEDINLHFTGDFHAVTSAHNLLSAMLDNHLHQGNALDFDMRRTIWKRAMDMNDRALRRIVVGLGGREGSYPREDRFDITAASELMAILALSASHEELRERISNIILGFTRGGKPVRAADMKAPGAMTALLRDALAPNLVQTLENSPAIIHCGPFANIAHGCNSILAARFGLKLTDYLVTEAGFGCDLGGEKFLDIFCPVGGFTPAAAVLVATIRAIKYHGGVKAADLTQENVAALQRGLPNLMHHLQILRMFGVPAIVALNLFPSDTEAEIRTVEESLGALKEPVARSEVFAKGGAGGLALANGLLNLLKSRPSQFAPLYNPAQPLLEKIETIAKKVYGADGVDYAGRSKKQIEICSELGYEDAYVCIAKTQYSFSDDARKIGNPTGFRLNIREVRLLGGARFVVPIIGEILTMPGLPKVPAAEHIDLLPDGSISNLS